MCTVCACVKVTDMCRGQRLIEVSSLLSSLVLGTASLSEHGANKLDYTDWPVNSGDQDLPVSTGVTDAGHGVWFLRWFLEI